MELLFEPAILWGLALLHLSLVPKVLYVVAGVILHRITRSFGSALFLSSACLLVLLGLTQLLIQVLLLTGILAGPGYYPMPAIVTFIARFALSVGLVLTGLRLRGTILQNTSVEATPEKAPHGCR